MTDLVPRQPIDGMPLAAYHAHPALSHSKLEVFRDDPALFWGQELGHFPRDWSLAMDLGTVAHELILLLTYGFTLIPKNVLSSDGKKSGNAWKQFAADHVGEILLKEKEAAEARAWRDAVCAHPMARKILNFDGNLREQSIFFQDAETGLELRSRLDILTPVFVCDFKSGQTVNPFAWAKMAYEAGYFRQADFYRKAAGSVGYNDVGFLFIAVKKSPSYAVECFVPDADTMAQAAAENRDDLRYFAECKTSDVWRPKDWGTLKTVRAPGWTFRQ